MVNCGSSRVEGSPPPDCCPVDSGVLQCSQPRVSSSQPHLPAVVQLSFSCLALCSPSVECPPQGLGSSSGSFFFLECSSVDGQSETATETQWSQPFINLITPWCTKGVSPQKNPDSNEKVHSWGSMHITMQMVLWCNQLSQNLVDGSMVATILIHGPLLIA